MSVFLSKVCATVCATVKKDGFLCYNSVTSQKNNKKTMPYFLPKFETLVGEKFASPQILLRFSRTLASFLSNTASPSATSSKNLRHASAILFNMFAARSLPEPIHSSGVWQARQLHSSDNEFLSNASGCAVSGCIPIPENKVLPQGFAVAHHHADKVPPRVHSGACNCSKRHLTLAFGRAALSSPCLARRLCLES